MPESRKIGPRSSGEPVFRPQAPSTRREKEVRAAGRPDASSSPCRLSGAATAADARAPSTQARQPVGGAPGWREDRLAAGELTPGVGLLCENKGVRAARGCRSRGARAAPSSRSSEASSGSTRGPTGRARAAPDRVPELPASSLRTRDPPVQAAGRTSRYARSGRCPHGGSFASRQERVGDACRRPDVRSVARATTRIARRFATRPASR